MIDDRSILRLRVTEQCARTMLFVQGGLMMVQIIQNEFKNECNCDFLNVPNFRIIQ
jgi:hypothetical protein